MNRRYSKKKSLRERDISLYAMCRFRASNMACKIADTLFDMNDRRRKIPLADRQAFALARAQCDPIIARVSTMLSNCSVDSLVKNKVNIMDYYTNCYDWIDPVVASILFEQVIKDEYKDKNNGNIYFDRHYVNKKYSSGDEGLPFASIHFDKDASQEEVIAYLKNHWDTIHAPNLAAPKQTQSNLEKIRETIIRALCFEYMKLSANDTIEIIEGAVGRNKLFSKIADNLFEKEVYTIRQRLRRDLENDWFVLALPVYRKDRQSNENIYKDWSYSYYINKYQDFFSKPDAKVERLVRFVLCFNQDAKRFSLIKT